MKLNIFARKASLRGRAKAAPKRPNGFISRRGGKLVDCNGKAIVMRESCEVEIIAARMKAELRALREKATKILSMPPAEDLAPRRKVVAVVRALKDARPNAAPGFTG